MIPTVEARGRFTGPVFVLRRFLDRAIETGHLLEMQPRLQTSDEDAHPMIRLCGHDLKPLAEGALWWAAQKTLIVSDLHLEKGSSFARAGQHLPPYDTRTTLALIRRLIGELKPERVISLGDSFHDPRAHERLPAEDWEAICALTHQLDWIWVEGNHDPDPPEGLGGTPSKEFRLGRLIFRHEPTGETGEISGHLHPCARLMGRGNKMVRRRCFITNGNSLILPSMGAFTGGLNVLEPVYQPLFPTGMKVFMTGTDRVYAIPTSRLVGDRLQKARWRL
ncbi:ligase-associated DNA damage response endonuclease PdeM [Ponticaulis sp.]|uniref:ligase-associated DNA damage response endonuclease PdeM n=1 Tax=Ponticaulis sp. TaxID=2020902 RepID=UPI0025ECF2D9|nr:ligase-associated DNA damage response endonuclease PdeM [Ponticaulis sp.]